MESSTEDQSTQEGGFYQIVTLLGLAALAVLVLAVNLDIGFVAITIGLILSLIAPNLQKRAMGQVAWPEIMLITGVSTYVVVLEKMGTISYVGDSVAGLASPILAALLLCFIGAVVSAFASSTAVLGSLIPLAVPFSAGRNRRERNRLHRRDGRFLHHRRCEPIFDEWRTGARKRSRRRPRAVLSQADGLRRARYDPRANRRVVALCGGGRVTAAKRLPQTSSLRRYF